MKQQFPYPYSSPMEDRRQEFQDELEYERSLQPMGIKRYKVTGIISAATDRAYPLPIIIWARGSATAKLGAAKSVGGFWNEDTIAIEYPS